MNVQEWAQKIVREAESPVIIELGAHHGQDTVQIYDACQRTPFYLAVEADPRNLSVFKQAIGPRKITLIHAAITDHEGQIIFHQCEGNDNASGSIRTPTRHRKIFPHITFEHDVEVPCLTLDGLAEQFSFLPIREEESVREETDGFRLSQSPAKKQVDLIWCDIQGAERDMIAGGQKTLAITRFLMVEADGSEMYDGQAIRPEFDALLPDFELLDEWPVDANALFRNRRLT